MFDKEQVQLQVKILEALHEIIHLLKERRFKLSIQGALHMITGAGTSGTITATYTVNGTPATPATPVVFTCDDVHVSFTPIDAFNVTATVPAGDPDTQITINATCCNSDGTTSTAAPLVIQLAAQTQTFSLSIAQTA